MPTTNYNYASITGHIRILPIRAALFYDSTNDIALNFFQIEAESSIGFLNPIKEPHYEGGDITIGYKIEPIFYIPENTFDLNSYELIDKLASFQNRKIELKVLLGNRDTWSRKPEGFVFPKSINSTAGMEIDYGTNLTFNFEIEQIEFRPRLVIKPSGVIISPTQIKVVEGGGNDEHMFK